MTRLQVVALGLLMAAAPARAALDEPCRTGAEALERRELERAETLLRRCLTARPGQVHSYLQLCAVYQLQGKEEDLYKVALEGLKRFPAEKRFYLTVGTRAGREKRYERAVTVLGEAFRRWPDDPAIRENLSSAHTLLGMQLLDAGKNEEAARHLREAVKLEPDDVEAQLNLGRALTNVNQSVEALAAFDRVLALEPGLKQAHFHRGMMLHGLAEYDRAVADLTREVEINPEYPPAYLFRGLCRIALGDWNAALPDLEIAAARMPENPKAHAALGRCLARLGRPVDAEPELRKAMELDPVDPAPVNALAGLLLELGRGAEAEALFKKAAELDRKGRSAAPGEIQFRSFEPRRKPQ